MTRAFYIVGPTATGKSEIGAEVARLCGGEVVSADAFQIYAGLPVLTAKPEPTILAIVPHHLIGAVPLARAMNAEQFRLRALSAIGEIHARGKSAFIVGGSGLYVKSLTHGLSRLPSANAKVRGELESLSTGELCAQLAELDPATAASVDKKNRRRLLRALEICAITGRPASEQRNRSEAAAKEEGVFVFRERDELYERINSRVEMMFANGVVDEVRAAGAMSQTASKALGLEQIRALLAGQISQTTCIASIQQATRRYAKRQLTWFARQTNFASLNLSAHRFSESIELIAQKARLSFSQQDD